MVYIRGGVIIVVVGGAWVCVSVRAGGGVVVGAGSVVRVVVVEVRD